MLVHSRAVVREGLRSVIERQSDLVVVAEAATVREAGAVGACPDVIVTDIDLPDARSADVISGLRGFFPRSSILVFTQNWHALNIQSAVGAGANGYLLENAPTDDLLTGIRAVATGAAYMQPSLGVEFLRSHAQLPDSTLNLTPEEQNILQLIALGHTNAEIARACYASLRTIESRRAHIHRKLGLATRSELVQFAREAGLLQPAQD
ncbi:MAG TPA: response regulator transcription factor [Acidimicrobiia bacterium]|jgi:DNA-binding NarL/FixJ family response regulator|nr:response regulator transcription factor [Acidimicrobiia bacterium]